MKESNMFPILSKEMLHKRTSLAPESMKAWMNFSNKVFEEGALSEKTKLDCLSCGSCHTMSLLH